MSHRN
ncbi:hypothetical protein D018_3706A, partial [Vibrio parahaemolyticus VP2007-007]